MITAELMHNPYLLETEVRFNGQKPRINSQIEKYEGASLKSWVGNVPKIFYDEMNGYDFDLNFTGTVSDFEELGQAFEKTGVSADQVRLFHKNELEDVDTKCREIHALLDWMEEHPNRKMNIQGFLTEHAELFKGAFPYIIIGGVQPENRNSRIRTEAVERAEHVQNTVLQNTPIVFCIDEETGNFREDLEKILSRNDVHQRQLFFLIKATLNRPQVVRILMDLGVKTPQVITGFYDEKVLKYLRDYPITSYIQRVIHLLVRIVAEIDKKLTHENEQSLQTNAAVHAEIAGYEERISKLKEVDHAFRERNRYNVPVQFQTIRKGLETQIQKWQNWKTKIVGDTEAEKVAFAFDRELENDLMNFIIGMREASEKDAVAVSDRFYEIYVSQGIDVSYLPNKKLEGITDGYEYQSLVAELLKLQSVHYEEPIGDLVGMFLKAEQKEPKRVVTYYYDQWRKKAAELLLPVADHIIQMNTAALQNYYDELAEDYHAHLMKLLDEQISYKDQAMEKLSDEERRLQEDQDWLQAIRDQLVQIERG